MNTLNNIGLPQNTVCVREYDPVWGERFEREKELLLKQFSGEILEVSHGGSTSVPGMAAKPIIDMFAAVPNLTETENLRARLESLTYNYRGEEGVPGRVLYAKGSEENRTHHLNLVEKTNEQWLNHISLREYYIRYPEVAKEYMELKEKLAAEFPNDRSAYGRGKREFVQSVLNQARAEGL